MNITEAKWYKTLMPKLYGWGAAVVILGALFKIEHSLFASKCYLLVCLEAIMLLSFQGF